jgi:hypothetical protein
MSEREVDDDELVSSEIAHFYQYSVVAINRSFLIIHGHMMAIVSIEKRFQI